MAFQISGADLRASGVFSRYNLAAVSAAADISLWNKPRTKYGTGINMGKKD
jgi:hypothetical protein